MTPAQWILALAIWLWSKITPPLQNVAIGYYAFESSPANSGNVAIGALALRWPGDD